MTIAILAVYGVAFFILGIIFMMNTTKPAPRVRTPNRVRYDHRVKRHSEHEERYW